MRRQRRPTQVPRRTARNASARTRVLERGAERRRLAWHGILTGCFQDGLDARLFDCLCRQHWWVVSPWGRTLGAPPLCALFGVWRLTELNCVLASGLGLTQGLSLGRWSSLAWGVAGLDADLV